ncbi:MAG: hypothetical protein ABJO30_04015 [Hyphomicrobiales bacterium]
MLKTAKTLLVSSLFTLTAGLSSAPAQSLADPDLLIIGDSQILFRGGPAYVDHFSKLAETCSALIPERAADFKSHFSGDVGVAGVRAAAINSWLAREGEHKDALCVPQKSWPKNTRGFGTLHTPDQKFHQTARDGNYPLCQPNQSPVETLFKDIAIKPKLLVFSMLGGYSKKWAKDKALADKDASNLAAQIPKNTPCLYLTTAPSFAEKPNAERLEGQNHFFTGIHKTRGACLPVKGLTDETISAFQGNNKFYKTRDDGTVRDVFHPNDLGVRTFLNKVSPAMCRALVTIIDRNQTAALKTNQAKK